MTQSPHTKLRHDTDKTVTAEIVEAELRVRYRQSAELHCRARAVIPGGIHLSGRPLVDGKTTPMYFQRGKGCRLWDADGHEYIDYLMAFGAQLLGYAHPLVDQAVAEQSTRGQLLSLNHQLHIEFIETLLPLFPGAEMGVFFKTGSEATTAALRIARRYTGRRHVARCGYHGWHDWCLPLENFVPEGLDRQVLEFDANDGASLERLFDANPNQVAAVILAPEMVLPYDPCKFKKILRITHANRALLIMDEVKTGIRVAPNSVSERAGIIPDIITVSKGLANGWPIAATLGRREVLDVAAGMHYSATFHGETSAMAAARATVRIVENEGVQQHIEFLGRRLIDGLNAIAEELGVNAVAYGEPVESMPFFKFMYPNEKLNSAMTRRFFQQVLAHGVLLHPRHMWFLSQSHTLQDVDITLDVARSALKHSL